LLVMGNDRVKKPALGGIHFKSHRLCNIGMVTAREYEGLPSLAM